MQRLLILSDLSERGERLREVLEADFECQLLPRRYSGQLPRVDLLILDLGARSTPAPLTSVHWSETPQLLIFDNAQTLDEMACHISPDCDFLCDPFSDGELVLRVRGLLRSQAGRNRQHQMLHTASEALDRALHENGALLRRLNHELRTPLHSIIGMNSVLCETAQPRQMPCVLAIEQASSQLIRLIDSLPKLTAERFDNPMRENREAEIGADPAGLLDALLIELQDYLATRGLSTARHYHQLPRRLLLSLSQNALTQVLRLLLIHASQRAPAGGVLDIGLFHTPEKGQLCIRIAAPGEGASQETRACLSSINAWGKQESIELTLARQLAQQQCFTLEVNNGESDLLGQDWRVELRVPLRRHRGSVLAAGLMAFANTPAEPPWVAHQRFED